LLHARLPQREILWLNIAASHVWRPRFSTPARWCAADARQISSCSAGFALTRLSQGCAGHSFACKFCPFLYLWTHFAGRAQPSTLHAFAGAFQLTPALFTETCSGCSPPLPPMHTSRVLEGGWVGPKGGTTLHFCACTGSNLPQPGFGPSSVLSACSTGMHGFMYYSHPTAPYLVAFLGLLCCCLDGHMQDH